MDSSILEEKFISNGMRKFKKEESIFGRGGDLISGTALRIRVSLAHWNTFRAPQVAGEHSSTALARRLPQLFPLFPFVPYTKG